MVALAAAALSVPTPAAAMAVGDPAKDFHMACIDGQTDVSVHLSAKETGTIDAILSEAQACNATTVTITVQAGDKVRPLPAAIPAGLKQVVIRGANGDRPFFAQHSEGKATVVNSPLEVSGLDIQGAKGDVFDVRNAFTLDSSVVAGVGTAVAAREAGVPGRVQIVNSTFRGAQIADLQRRGGEVHIQGNSFVHVENGTETAITLGPIATNDSRVTVISNSFTLGLNTAVGVYVMRPNVHIAGNQFVGDSNIGTETISSPVGNTGDETTAIHLDVPSVSGAMKNVLATNIVITRNEFSGLNAVSQRQHAIVRPVEEITSLNAGQLPHVRFEFNEVSLANPNPFVVKRNTLTGDHIAEHKVVNGCNYHGAKLDALAKTNPEHMVLKEWPREGASDAGFKELCTPAKQLVDELNQAGANSPAGDDFGFPDFIDIGPVPDDGNDPRVDNGVTPGVGAGNGAADDAAGAGNGAGTGAGNGDGAGDSLPYDVPPPAVTPGVGETESPKPTDDATNTPSEPKPTEPKPVDPKPTEPKPVDPKPTEPKPVDPKPSEPKPTEPKPTPSTPVVPAPVPVAPVPAPVPAPAPVVPAPVAPAPTTPAPTTPAPGQPSIDTAPAPVRDLGRFGGDSRVETATSISRSHHKDGESKVVILARADVAADSVSAVPLADQLDAPVLLTQPDSLHPATEAEIKRVVAQGGKVIIMGGNVAVHQSVEDKVKGLGYATERVAGANRAATAVVTAERLAKDGKAKEVLLVDGQDWQPDLIAGPAAAKIDGVTLLTNGAAMAEETKAFLAGKNLKVTAIGDVAKQAGNVKDAVTAKTPTELSVAVAQRFFTKPAAVGLATTATFADALAGGAHAAEHDAPILLVPAAADQAITTWMKDSASVKQVFVYGGPKAISEDVVKDLMK